MRVRRSQHDGSSAFDLLDEEHQPIAEVSGFLRHLSARGCSPNTLSAYAHDLLHFYQFLDQAGLTLEGFWPTRVPRAVGAPAPGSKPQTGASARPRPGNDRDGWQLNYLPCSGHGQPDLRRDLVVLRVSDRRRATACGEPNSASAGSSAGTRFGAPSAIYGSLQPPASGAASRAGQDHPTPASPT